MISQLKEERARRLITTNLLFKGKKMTLTIMGLIVTLTINLIQVSDTQHSIMLIVIYLIPWHGMAPVLWLEKRFDYPIEQHIFGTNIGTNCLKLPQMSYIHRCCEKWTTFKYMLELWPPDVSEKK
jgi:hypothetical protein